VLEISFFITTVSYLPISICDFHMHPINDRFTLNSQIMFYFSLAFALKQRKNSTLPSLVNVLLFDAKKGKFIK